MSNSSLVTHIRLSPNCNKPRNHAIDKITIHHMACNITVERCGQIFAPSTRQGSSNYGVDGYGHVGLYVDEANRAWTSGSPWNDNRAVTIEVANDGGAPDWHVSDTAYNKMLDLVEDICKRNGISRLNFVGDSSGNMTLHKYFQATGCPGPYLERKMPEIAAEINRRLNGGGTVYTPVNITYQVYDMKKRKWLPNVKNRDDYAGNKGNPFSSAYVSADVGNIYYKIRLLEGSRWLPEVKNREDFAGILNKAADAIMIRSDVTTLHYQVELEDGTLLPAVTGYSEKDAANGYAGLTGKKMSKLWIWADPIVQKVEPKVEPKSEENKEATIEFVPDPIPEPTQPSESEAVHPADPTELEETPSEEKPSDEEPSVETPIVNETTSSEKPSDEETLKPSELGDVNGDGQVDNNDVVQLKKYLDGEKVEVFSGVDVNQDGKIDDKDLELLKQRFASCEEIVGDDLPENVNDVINDLASEAIDVSKGKRTLLLIIKELLEKVITWINVKLQTKYQGK